MNGSVIAWEISWWIFIPPYPTWPWLIRWCCLLYLVNPMWIRIYVLYLRKAALWSSRCWKKWKSPCETTIIYSRWQLGKEPVLMFLSGQFEKEKCRNSCSHGPHSNFLLFHSWSVLHHQKYWPFRATPTICILFARVRSNLWKTTRTKKCNLMKSLISYLTHQFVP